MRLHYSFLGQDHTILGGDLSNLVLHIYAGGHVLYSRAPFSFHILERFLGHLLERSGNNPRVYYG